MRAAHDAGSGAAETRTDAEETLRAPDLFHSYGVYRRGGVVHRPANPWTSTVHSLLRHLEAVGFAGAPRVVGTGFDEQGRETVTYIPGEFVHSGLWRLEGAHEIGRLFRDLHHATAGFRAPNDAVWYPWFGRNVGSSRRVIGHCDVGPWNIVARDGRPVALIDWDWAGPADPLFELAQACWLNAKLHDDEVATRESLPSLGERARHLRAIVDGYELPAQSRRGFVTRMVEYAVHYNAYQADDAMATLAKRVSRTEGAQHDDHGAAAGLLWSVVWPARAAAWMLRHRRALQNALA
jgi:hypothetical protein